MAFSKQIIAFVVAAASLVAASPVGVEAREIVAVFQRADSVTVCHNVNFGGPCVFAPNSNGVCHNVGASDNDVISSIRLGAATNCIFWADGGCSGSSLFVSQDIPDLRNFGFNDVISSFTCFATA
ncbi:hypothetical protein ONZ45_g6748 [Pleurotus djamor]|nr:hypothetical protein ONZ45_g6748 [Pleurotus djamor]